MQSLKADIAKSGEGQKAGEDWWHKYYGSWNDFPETAEEMIEVIEESKKIQASQRVEKLRQFAGDAKFPDSATSKNDVYEQ